MLKPFALVAVISVSQAITLQSASESKVDVDADSWWASILAD